MDIKDRTGARIHPSKMRTEVDEVSGKISYDVMSARKDELENEWDNP